ncbi:PadR family transcriptional regulator [Clostridium estertheticum]|uniref:PadR family transcriptional regulator n=1 Tax=Clostridium estertheticum TaxID=238834 RepID=UPI00217E3BA6|nr:PadR family transcriptional regulator [Clostridium estertheticum]
MDSWTKIQSGSIYYALNKLEKEGLIVLSEKVGSGAKARKVYSITQNGKRELRELVKQKLNFEYIFLSDYIIKDCT